MLFAHFHGLFTRKIRTRRMCFQTRLAQFGFLRRRYAHFSRHALVHDLHLPVADYLHFFVCGLKDHVPPIGVRAGIFQNSFLAQNKGNERGFGMG